MAAELALAIVLLTGAGLMLKSFWRMNASPPGSLDGSGCGMETSASTMAVECANMAGSLSVDRGLGALRRVEALGGTFERDRTTDVKPVTKVDLGFTKITDDDLRHLAELKSLRFLNLRSTAISDKGLAYLQGLDGLAAVDQ